MAEWRYKHLCEIEESGSFPTLSKPGTIPSKNIQAQTTAWRRNHAGWGINRSGESLCAAHPGFDTLFNLCGTPGFLEFPKRYHLQYGRRGGRLAAG